jgi:hypothetical protein
MKGKTKKSPPRRDLAAALLGRSFVSPGFEYLVVGGGLSLIVTALVLFNRSHPELLGTGPMAGIVLFSNGAHFAASTVRLYTKPGATGSYPFLSRVFPGIAILVMTLCLVYVGRVGSVLDTFYLTWSPYHYAAQVYGLSVMYSYRSGCRLEGRDKSFLWWVCMIPFFYMAVHLLEGRLPAEAAIAAPALVAALPWIKIALVCSGVVAPVVLFFKVWTSPSGPMPLIALLMMLSNAVWFFLLDPLNAFLWATVFHGLQYLAIVMIFDVGDRMAVAGPPGDRLARALVFYGLSFGLGCILFVLLPKAYEAMGFDYYDSRLVSVAIINIHHFIVDAYIWKLGRTDSNRQVVEAVA